MHLGSMLPQWDTPRSGLGALYNSIRFKHKSSARALPVKFEQILNLSDSLKIDTGIFTKLLGMLLN